MSTQESTTVTSVIEPAQGWELPQLREVWNYRDLLYLLIRRDVAVRYKQTVIGGAWVLVQPIVLTIAFSLFLGLLFDTNPAGDIPYPVFVLCGLTMWFYFSQAVGLGGVSTLTAGQLISKVYFPRLILPLAAIFPPALDLVLAFGVLVVTMLLYGLTPPATIVFVPLVMLNAMLIALGLSLLLSALAVRYRDVQLGLGFGLQIMLYASAVIYPVSRVPTEFQSYLAFNPMAGIMESFRWAALPGAEAPDALFVIAPVAFGVLTVIAGLFYFQRAQRSFVDVF